jgi:DNA-binding transcriptional LysR family regulator
VRAGSFTAAAKEAGLPKSSLSRTLTNLEAELGVRLLHRTTRKLALTEIGQAYFESVRPAFEIVEDATFRALEHDTNPHGLVRIAAPADFRGLARELTRFMRTHPGIQIDARLGARYVDLVAEGVDLAVRIGRLEDSSLTARKLGDVEVGLMASPSYLRRHGRPRTIEDLADHHWILFRPRASRTAVSLTGPDGERTIDVTASLIADDMRFCHDACEAGAGIARLPLTGDDRLERVLPRWSAGLTQAWILTPASKLLPRRVSLLRDHLVANLPKHLPRPTSQRAQR